MDCSETEAINTADVLIEDLCQLLEKQTAMAIRGDLVGVEALMPNAENLMQKIAQLRITDSASLTERKNKLQNMYKKLSLIITSSKDETFAELIKARKSKTVLGAYKKGAC
jgi:hypothetical protein